MIEHNTSISAAYGNNGSGGLTSWAAAIWVRSCTNAVLQYNEAYDTRTTYDGQGFDADIAADGTIFQYNYSHDNKGGFLLIMNTSQNTTARYNISQNDRVRVFNIPDCIGNIIYNNTIYVKSGLSTTIDNSVATGAVYYMYNNLIYNLGSGGYASPMRGIYENNCFYGNHPSSEPNDPYKVTGDPKLVKPGGSTNGLNTCNAYKIQQGSSCINTGKVISNNGEKDFFGNILYNEAPDIGAHEYYDSSQTSSGSINIAPLAALTVDSTKTCR